LLRELQHKNKKLAKEMHKTTLDKHPQLLHSLTLQSLQELSCNAMQLQHKSCWQLPAQAVTHTAASAQHTAHAVVQEARPTK
jgi:hypothetical protein